MKKQIFICNNCLKEVDENYVEIEIGDITRGENFLVIKKNKKEKTVDTPLHFCDENCMCEFFKNLIKENKNG